MEVWGRVLDLSQEEKNISQRTKSMWPGGYRATQKKKKKAKSIPGVSRKVSHAKDKGCQEAKPGGVWSWMESGLRD